MYEQGLTLNNLQGLMCHKTKRNNHELRLKLVDDNQKINNMK